MELSVHSPEDGSLLRVLRATLEDADEALICSAFVSFAGAHLVGRQLEKLGPRARLLTTTVFGSTQPSALDALLDLGVQVSTLNPGSGTYHPKLYLATRGTTGSAIVGSSNLTNGIVNNFEAVALIRGSRGEPALREAWELGERFWSDSRRVPWIRSLRTPPAEFDDKDLLAQIESQVQKDPLFWTLGRTPRPNTVVAVGAEGLWVTTRRTDEKGGAPQLVPAWMIELAYGYLMRHGVLTNRYLLTELRVHRSSFVCGLLARLEGIRVGDDPNRVELRTAARPEQYMPFDARLETASIAADAPLKRPKP